MFTHNRPIFVCLYRTRQFSIARLYVFKKNSLRICNIGFRLIFISVFSYYHYLCLRFVARCRQTARDNMVQ